MTSMLRREPHRSFGEQATIWIASLVSVCVALAAVAFPLTLLWPYDPLPSLSLTADATVRAGADLDVQLTYCKTTDWVPREVRWSLVNDVTVSLDGPKAALPVGCEDNRRVALPLSDHIAPGRYRVQIVVIYQPWPWREVRYIRETPTPVAILP